MFFTSIRGHTPSIAGNFWIDFHGPALDTTGEGSGILNSLEAQPRGGVETAHAVMAVADDFPGGLQCAKTGLQRTKRDQLGALDAASLVFPGFANIHEQQFVAAIQTRLDFRWSNFQFFHHFSFPGRHTSMPTD